MEFGIPFRDFKLNFNLGDVQAFSPGRIFIYAMMHTVSKQCRNAFKEAFWTTPSQYRKQNTANGGKWI